MFIIINKLLVLSRIANIIESEKMPCSLTKSSDCVCPCSNTAKQKRKHRSGIIHPFSVLSFCYRLDGPDCPLAWVQIPLFLFLELFIFIGVHMSLPRCSEMIIPYYTLNTTGYNRV